jgi:hypothetical protein
MYANPYPRIYTVAAAAACMHACMHAYRLIEHICFESWCSNAPAGHAAHDAACMLAIYHLGGTLLIRVFYIPIMYYRARQKANTTLDPKNIWSSEKYTELLKIYGALKNIQIPPPASTTHYVDLTSGGGGRGNGLCLPAAESVYFSELRIFFRAPYIF